MKPCNYFIKLFISSFLLTGIFSCIECPECPKDRELWDCLDKSIPYQIGETTIFTNIASDTMEFLCNERNIFENTHAAVGAREEECCTLYTVENLQCQLLTSENASLSVSTFSLGENDYTMNVSLQVDTIDVKTNWLINGFCTSGTFDRILDEVQIANNSFSNVGEIESLSQNVIFYWSLNSLGVVGFKINNEEWALLQ